jgi:predicted regulator of Ras-like GTPase activity (Roadblock/LC7/MglB family)
VNNARWLSPIADTPELLTAVVISPDGMPIESLREDGPGLSLIAAECAGLARSLASPLERLKGGRLRRLSLTGNRFTLLLFQLDSGILLAALAEPTADVRRLEHELATVALNLSNAERHTETGAGGVL